MGSRSVACHLINYLNGKRCVKMTTDDTENTEKKDLSKELSAVQMASLNYAISHVFYPCFPCNPWFLLGRSLPFELHKKEPHELARAVNQDAS